MINTLNAYSISLYLLISLKTTNTSESFSICILVDSKVTGVSIYRSFIKKYGFNTYKLSKSIPVYNIDSTPNKNGQISEIVDIVL